jgi:hypothetical protein
MNEPRLFLPLDDAARYLATQRGDQTSVQTVLQYVIDGLLPLTVRLPAVTKAMPGQKGISFEEEFAIYQRLPSPESFPTAESPILESSPTAESPMKPSPPSRFLHEVVSIPGRRGAEVISRFAPESEDDPVEVEHGFIFEHRVVDLDDEVDMLMIGDACQLVRDLWTGAPRCARVFQYGLFVRSTSLDYRLLQPFDEGEYAARQQRAADGLQRYIVENNLPWDEADELEQALERRQRREAEQQTKSRLLQLYMPASDLPSNSVLGVRKEALDDLLAYGNSPGRRVDDLEVVPGRNGPEWIIRKEDLQGDEFQDWWVPARYFARQFAAKNPELPRKKLSEMVAAKLQERGIGPRGSNAKPYNANTVYKALGVDLTK